MIKLCVTGGRSQIVTEVVALARLSTSEWCSVRLPDDFSMPPRPPACDRYLLCAGVLHGKSLFTILPREIEQTLAVNLVSTIRMIEMILTTNPKARVGVMGSLSGLRGSFDKVYAASKAALHQYVMAREVLETQQLLCWAPGIVAGTTMTIRRHDYPQVLEERAHTEVSHVAQTIIRELWGERLVSGVHVLGNTIPPRGKVH